MTRCEQAEAGAAVHLAVEHLEHHVDAALDFAGAVGQGQAVGDGLLVGADAGGEGAQLGQVADLDGGQPVLEVVLADAAGHHLGEAGHGAGQTSMCGQRARIAASSACSSSLRDSGRPAGDLACLGHGRLRGRGGGHRAERADVAAHRLHAAGPAAGLQHAGVGDAFVPPLVDPGLERVQLGLPAGGLDQLLVHVRLAGEPLHCGPDRPHGAVRGLLEAEDPSDWDTEVFDRRT